MRTFLKMLRIPNLLMIALTFMLLRYLVFIPVYRIYHAVPQMGSLNFMLMVIATMMIAAAGYMSNDYFDVVTDRVNKPEKLYIGKQLSAGSAFAASLLLSIMAAVLACGLSWMMKSGLPAFLLLLALAVAWWYAIHLKKSLLWGNLAVSCMTAGTIAMAWLIEKQASSLPAEPSGIITAIIVAVSIFAFLLSLLREIVKDMEDMEGDSLIECRSLPIVKGIAFTKKTLTVIASVTFVLLISAQLILLSFSGLVAAAWLLLGVEVPLTWFLYLLRKAKIKSDFHTLSTLLKWIMLGGIGSMVAGQF